MKAIVFGATGFIGSHVTEQLVQAGHLVTAITRPTSDTTFLQALGVITVTVDLHNVEAITAVIEPDSIVYNCIAFNGKEGTRENYQQVEVEMTKRIALSAARAHARRYIQLSSIILYGTKLPDHPIDETHPPHPDIIMDQVCWERELAVQEVAAETGLDTVILRPASTIGARSRDTFYETIRQLHQRNRFPLIGGGTALMSLVDTRDLGQAMVWLGMAGDEVRGQTYLLAGFEASWWELKQALDEMTGTHSGALRLPKLIAYTLAVVAERFGSALLNRRVIRALATNRVFDDSKIRRAGFRPHYQLQDALQAAVA